MNEERLATILAIFIAVVFVFIFLMR